MTGITHAGTQDTFTADGILMETTLDVNGVPSNAIAVIEIDVPNEDSLVLPVTFTGDPLTATLQAFFKENSIEIQSGILEESQNIDYLIFDVSSYKNQTGELKLVLNNSGSEIAELFVIESVNYTDADIAAVYGVTSTGENSDGSGGSIGIELFLFLAAYSFLSLRRRKHKT